MDGRCNSPDNRSHNVQYTDPIIGQVQISLVWMTHKYRLTHNRDVYLILHYMEHLHTVAVKFNKAFHFHRLYIQVSYDPFYGISKLNVYHFLSSAVAAVHKVKGHYECK